MEVIGYERDIQPRLTGNTRELHVSKLGMLELELERPPSPCPLSPSRIVPLKRLVLSDCWDLWPVRARAHGPVVYLSSPDGHRLVCQSFSTMSTFSVADGFEDSPVNGNYLALFAQSIAGDPHRQHLSQYRAKKSEDMANKVVAADFDAFLEAFLPAPPDSSNKPRPSRNPFLALRNLENVSEGEISQRFVSGWDSLRWRAAPGY